MFFLLLLATPFFIFGIIAFFSGYFIFGLIFWGIDIIFLILMKKLKNAKDRLTEKQTALK